MISTHIGYMGVPVYKCVVTFDDSNQVYRITQDISVSVSLRGTMYTDARENLLVYQI